MKFSLECDNHFAFPLVEFATGCTCKCVLPVCNLQKIDYP